MARPIDPEKRPAILAAARTVFLDKGYTDTRMSEIASYAGVAVGTLYLYFESKEAIARAMAESFYTRIEAIIVPALEPALDARTAPERFRQLVHLAFTIAVEERELLLLSPSGCTDFTPDSSHAHSTNRKAHGHAKDSPSTARKAARTDFLRQLGASLAALMATGRIRRYEDPVVLAELIVALSQPVIRTYITLAPADRERYEAIFTDFLETALMQPVPSTSISTPDASVHTTNAPHARATSHAPIAFG